MHQIKKSTSGKWMVLLRGSVVYVTNTKKKAQEYIDALTKNEKAPL